MNLSVSISSVEVDFLAHFRSRDSVVSVICTRVFNMIALGGPDFSFRDLSLALYLSLEMVIWYCPPVDLSCAEAFRMPWASLSKVTSVSSPFSMVDLSFSASKSLSCCKSYSSMWFSFIV